MAESLVPPPSFIIMMHCETEWPCHQQLQPVHAILGPLHPSKETSLPIPNLQHAAFNQHARAALVHLPNVDDRVPQAWDPVHWRQDLVLTALSGEDDGALATDVDDGAIPELDGTLHCSVMLGEHFAAACHVVVMLMSRYQPSRQLLVLEVVSRNTYALVSSRWTSCYSSSADLTVCGGADASSISSTMAIRSTGSSSSLAWVKFARSFFGWWQSLAHWLVRP
jgi:hypothetical protein